MLLHASCASVDEMLDNTRYVMKLRPRLITVSAIVHCAAAFCFLSSIDIKNIRWAMAKAHCSHISNFESNDFNFEYSDDSRNNYGKSLSAAWIEIIRELSDSNPIIPLTISHLSCWASFAVHALLHVITCGVLHVYGARGANIDRCQRWWQYQTQLFTDALRVNYIYSGTLQRSATR